MSNGNGKVVVSSGGFGTVALVALLAYLKVNGYIQVSWWIVFLPLYLGLGILLGVGLIALLIFGVVVGLKTYQDSKRYRRK
jgi:hypothetical protein